MGAKTFLRRSFLQRSFGGSKVWRGTGPWDPKGGLWGDAHEARSAILASYLQRFICVNCVSSEEMEEVITFAQNITSKFMIFTTSRAAAK